VYVTAIVPCQWLGYVGNTKSSWETGNSGFRGHCYHSSSPGCLFFAKQEAVGLIISDLEHKRVMKYTHRLSLGVFARIWPLTFPNCSSDVRVVWDQWSFRGRGVWLADDVITSCAWSRCWPGIPHSGIPTQSLPRPETYKCPFCCPIYQHLCLDKL
jgi:hypothetical protein